MALDFTGSTGSRVDVSKDATIDDLTAFTFLGWVYAPTLPAGRGVFSKGDTIKHFATSATLTELDLVVGRATTNASATTGNGFSTDKWYFVAATYDETDGPRIFYGDLTTAPVEAPYDSRIVGSGGSTADNNSNLQIGNMATAANQWPGYIDTIAYINERLSLDDLKQLWRDRRKWIRPGGATRGYWELGRNGTGTQPDYSGNLNNGTVTGATVALNAPLAPTFGFEQPALTFPVAPPKELGYFDVSDFGATGAGVTNDAPAIQAALEAAGAAGGGVVFFPPRTYKIGTQISVANLHNLTIDARGALFTLPAVDGVSTLLQAVVFDECDELKWLGGELSGSEEQGTNAPSTKYHKFFKDALDNSQTLGHHQVPVFFLFRKCHGITIRALRSRGLLRAAYLNQCDFASVVDFDFEGIMRGDFIKRTTPADNAERAEGDAIRHNVGVTIGGGRDIGLFNLRGNHADRPGGEERFLGSIALTGGRGITAAGDAEEFPGLPSGVLCDHVRCRRYQDHTVYFDGTQRALVVRDVLADGDMLGKGGNRGPAIKTSRGDSVLIEGCRLKNVYQGIAMEGGQAPSPALDPYGHPFSDYTVRDNVFDGVEHRAIAMQRTGSVGLGDVNVIGNHIRDHKPDKPELAAIYVGDCDRVRVMNNTVEKNASTVGDYGVFVGRDEHSGLLGAQTCREITVSGNTVVFPTAGGGGRTGILISGVEDAIVIGNRTINMGSSGTEAGIVLREVAEVVFDDNRAESPLSRILCSPAGRAYAHVTIGSRNVGQQQLNSTVSKLPTRVTGVKAWWTGGHRRVFRDSAGTAPPNHGADCHNWIDRIGNFSAVLDTSDPMATAPTFRREDEDIASLLKRPHLEFDGSNNYLSYSTPDPLGTHTSGGVITVCKLDTVATNTYGTIWSTSGENTDGRSLMLAVKLDDLFLRVQQKNDGATWDVCDTAANAVMSNRWHLIELRSNGSAYTILVDDIVKPITVTGGANSGDWFGDTSNRDNFAIGVRRQKGIIQHWEGGIAEVIVYDDNTTASDRDDMIQFLREKYGI